jgi:hypothetical protein
MKTVCDLKTGAVTSSNLTPAEEAAMASAAAAEAAINTPEALEARCKEFIDENLVFKAKCLSDLAFRLGKSPSSLTVGERVAERDRIAAIYKALVTP